MQWLTRLALCVLLVVSASAATLGNHTNVGAAANTNATSAAIDTTGETLLVIVGLQVSIVTATTIPTPTDSKGNTWASLTLYTSGAVVARVQIWYVCNPTVGTGHTVTITGNPAANTYVFAGFHGGVGGGAGCLVSGSGNGVAGGTQKPGSVTPSAAGDLLITALAGDNHVNVAVTGGLSIFETSTAASAGRAAWLSAANTSAVDPTWTPWLTTNIVSAIGVFTAGSSTPPAARRRFIH